MEELLSMRSLSEERVRPHLDSKPHFFLPYTVKPKTTYTCIKEIDRKGLCKPISFVFYCSLELCHPQKLDLSMPGEFTCRLQWST